jgi:hypothetical protein
VKRKQKTKKKKKKMKKWDACWHCETTKELLIAASLTQEQAAWTPTMATSIAGERERERERERF